MTQAQKSQDQIRNIAISGSLDNGSKYLHDIFIQKWGVQTNKDAILTDNELQFYQEFQSQCGIKNLYYTPINSKKGNEDGYLINLMKSQNNYHGQTESLARLSDGAIVIINFQLEINYEIETIIRAFLKEQNRMVFFINKIDKAFLKLNLNGEQIYLNLNRIIEKINQIIYLYEPDSVINPAFGQITFGSAKQQWGFTCLQFAQQYEIKFGIEHQKLAKKLWGDHYFDATKKQWSTQNASIESQPLKRAFVTFILDPILKLSQAIVNGQKDVVSQMTERIGIQLSEDIRQLDGKKLLSAILNSWINLADSIMSSCVFHIPPPRVAQKYRAAHLFKLDKEDKLLESIKDCNPQGPLVIQICLMIPYKQEFISIGRVYSGTIHTGQQIRILGSQYKEGSKSDLFQSTVGQTFYFPIGEPAYIEQVPSGNIVGIKGIDQFIKGTCTITDVQLSIQMLPIQLQQDKLVKITITPVEPAQLTFVIDAIRQLIKLNPTISLTLDPCLILAANSYHFLQYFLDELVNKYLKSVEIRKSNYFVSYKETITGISQDNELKTPNKHNIIGAQATPLSDNLLNQIESDYQSMAFLQSIKINSNNWYQSDKLQIFAFGPNNLGPNILVNKTSPEDYHHISEIIDHLNTSWQWFTKEGALCEEEQRGVQVNILKYLSHADIIHRGAGQILPTARRLFYGCQLQAQPRLQEPVFLVEIHSNIQVIDQVYKCINNAQGIVIEEKSFAKTSFQKIIAYVNGPNIFQFHDQLNEMTQNKAYSLSSFDHWSLLNSDPLEESSEAHQILQDIRAKKGLPSKIPQHL
ncbi:unnamed protein product (macronuclear) [Paramecium tetraurelia]|uniref:Tr-type G domain-containing protein n=1 Tax=Paramecium tetraurelia TaxID=5888 RepID=A0C617_PARTE|nr:uncharacterized protein GSPATT00035363001 [Paramecium tetraurelia]CAK66234.1 unnamed protein product [Paramecium tetraurelia]|eukprot:XP_001433631.1 hypothetical protein (macronuclear) [Paramecium tetraurelia strain d4-2]